MMLLVNSEQTDYLPIRFQLGGNNNNNKLSGKTLIVTYSLSRSTSLRLQLIDLDGKILQEFVFDKRNAGNYSTDFNVADLKSGKYYFKIFVGTYCETKEILFSRWVRKIFLSLLILPKVNNKNIKILQLSNGKILSKKLIDFPTVIEATGNDILLLFHPVNCSK